jgi:hypothetical protein
MQPHQTDRSNTHVSCCPAANDGVDDSIKKEQDDIASQQDDDVVQVSVTWQQWVKAACAWHNWVCGQHSMRQLCARFQGGFI